LQFESPTITESYGCTDIETGLILYKGKAKFTYETTVGDTAKRNLTSFLFDVHVKLVLEVAGCAKFSALITCQLAEAKKVTRPSLQLETTHGRNVLGRVKRHGRREERYEARKHGRKGGRGEGIMEETKTARKN
jgi:hypothetical protein